MALTIVREASGSIVSGKAIKQLHGRTTYLIWLGGLCPMIGYFHRSVFLFTGQPCHALSETCCAS